MSQLALDSMGPVCVHERSQYFTPEPIARRMVEWVRPMLDDATRRAYTLRVLEPSAGSGALVREVRALAPGARIDAVELDPSWAAHLRTLGGCDVYEGDYLARPAPAARYHVAPCNVPFSGGEEVDHLAKLLDECERVIAHLPVRSLHGVDRHASIWSRIGIDWWLRREARLVRRPKYSGAGGSDEIVVVDLRRVPGPCEVEWW